MLLWSAPVATFTRAEDMTLLCEVCPPDGLAPTAMDCTWLLRAHPHRRSGRGTATTTNSTSTAATTTARTTAAGQEDQARTEAEPAQLPEHDSHRTVVYIGNAATNTCETATPQYSNESVEEEEGEEGGVDVHEVAGPWARQLMVVAAKPCGAVFAWRSGAWRPAIATAGGALEQVMADSRQVPEPPLPLQQHSRDLEVACSAAGGAASCLLPGAHGTYHSSSIALAAGQPLFVSGGIDGAVKCWTVSDLKLPPALASSAGTRLQPLSALHLTEVPGGLHRLDPCSGSLPDLPAQVRSLTLSRQAVHGVAVSGNGLVFAILRTTSTRQLDMAKNVMIHGRVLGGTVHLMTPYSMVPATLPSPPSPRLIAAGLMFQSPVASCLWDIYALALRSGLVAASMLPPIPAHAWDSGLEDEATAADDAAALEQVHGVVSGHAW